MRRLDHRSRSVLLAIVVCAVAGGCTGSDPIPSSVATALIQLEATTSDTGRYEDVSLRLRRLAVRPDDPVVVETLGPYEFTLLRSPLAWSFASGNAESPTVALPPGRYRVVSLQIETPILRDTSPTGSDGCLESFATLPSRTPGQATPPDFVSLSEEDLDASLTIPPASAVRLTVAFDLTALIAAYESAFVCTLPDVDPQCFPPSPDVACIKSFDSEALTAAIPDIFSVR